MHTRGFDARGAAQALKAAIARGDVDVEPLYGGAPGGPRVRCPLHNGGDPNFEIYEGGTWRCHSRCGAGGDVFSFVAVRDLDVDAGAPLRGSVFASAVRRTFEALGVDLEAYGCARAPTVASKKGGKVKPYPPANEVARLLAFAHEVATNGEPFTIGGRARPGVGTNAVAAGLGLCVELGADEKKHRPAWAARWPAGKLFATYDHVGALASVHLRPDNESRGKGKNPPKFNPSAFLMNAPMRALVGGESREAQDRARLLGYQTAKQEAVARGVLITEGPPAWCAWARWHAGPVGAVCGQDPSIDWMRRIPKSAPVLLDFDPDAAGLKYLAAALRGLVAHEDVRVSARMRWYLDRRDDAKANAEAVAHALAQARTSAPELKDPDELESLSVEAHGFARLSAEERVDIIGQGQSYGAKWTEALRLNAEGKIVASEGNLLAALEADERWAGVLGRDERSDRLVVMRKPPVPEMARGAFPREFRDEDASFVAAWYEREIGVEFRNNAVHRAIAAHAALHSFDRVREFFDRVADAWDGAPRLDRWLPDFVGAADTPLVRAIGAKWLISGVARTYRPGCKADYVLVLEGPQGIGKSTAFATLCPEPEYFTDAIPDLRNEKAVAEILSSGALIAEMPELDSMAKAEVSSIKATITRREERFRAAYGHHVRTRPRRIILCATTNDGAYLRDQTGNRRFWPVRASRVDVDALESARDQLWAEAVVRYRAGETWYLDDPDLEQAVKVEQEARREIDPWETPIESYLETWREMAEKRADEGGVLRLPNLPGDCMERLNLSTGSTTLRESRRVNAVLRRLGWERVQRRDGENGARRWAWEPSASWSAAGTDEVSPGFGLSPGDGRGPGDGFSSTITGMSPRHQVESSQRNINGDVLSAQNQTNKTRPYKVSGGGVKPGAPGDSPDITGVFGIFRPGDSRGPGDGPGDGVDDDDGWGPEKCAEEEPSRW